MIIEIERYSNIYCGYICIKHKYIRNKINAVIQNFILCTSFLVFTVWSDIKNAI